MPIEGIRRTDGVRGPYDYLLDDTYQEEGGQSFNATQDPAQQRAFLDQVNGYVEQLEGLDLPPEYLQNIHQVLADQLSLVFGKKVAPAPGGQGGEGIGEVAAPAQSGLATPSARKISASGGPDAVGPAPAGMPQELWNSCVKAGKKTGVDPYLLAAQMEKESRYGQALQGSPSAGDGVMQVEPSTRAAYASKFESVMGHPYDHGNVDDQVAMAAVILADKGGSPSNMLMKYNGGDNWRPGTCDSYGRVIKADEYAVSVLARAEEMRGGPA